MENSTGEDSLGWLNSYLKYTNISFYINDLNFHNSCNDSEPQ